MVTEAPRKAAILLAVAFILCSVALTLFVWRSLGGESPLAPKGYQFHASFVNAGQLQPHADVRIAGVGVGRVVLIKPDNLRTDATIQIDPEYAPIRADTRAILRQKTLLGETFVALTPGSRAAPNLADGGRLPVANVQPTQPLDRILGTLDERTRGDLRRFLTGGAAAIRGRSQDLNDALGQLDPLSAQLEAMVGILDRERSSVGGLVRDSGTLLRTIGERRASLQRLVESGEAVLATTAARDRAVTGTVRELPPLLTELRATSRAAINTSRVAAPVLHELRPVAPLVVPALRSMRTLAPAVRGVLADLNGALPVAQRALPAVAHLINSLRPFIAVLDPAAQEITPIVELVTAYRKELIGTMGNVAASLQATAPGLDGKPVHYLRALVPIDEEAIVGYPQRLPSNRHNAYFAPGGLAQLAHGGLLASDCRNTGNAQVTPVIGTGAPPCKQQPGWKYGGKTRYYQHVARGGGGSGGGG
jgi:phospholipid/cholesterol/gamma-HCH transport system substrate-binding protein